MVLRVDSFHATLIVMVFNSQSSTDAFSFPSITPEQAYELDQEHVFHSWSAQKDRKPLNITEAQGSYVWDSAGNKILDFSSQLVFTNIGHQHPYVIEAVRQQAGTLATVAPQHVNDKRSLAAKMISDKLPAQFNKVFFTNGGQDANEHAIRLAKSYTGRDKIASLYRSYHGGTGNMIRVTGEPRRWASDTSFSDTVHFIGPYLYRSEFYASTEQEECERALHHLDHIVQLEGPHNFAAIIMESIPGSVGILVPPPGYLRGVKEICAKHGIVLILDEVMSGFGRAGQWFAHLDDGVEPDLITFAKGVNSGYVPLGGVVISDAIAQVFDHRPYPGGLTYSGHPLSCAAAVATMQVMADEGVVEHARSLGESFIGPALQQMQSTHPIIGDVRGRGVFWAIELVKDPQTKEPVAPYGGSSQLMKTLTKEILSKGVLVFAAGNRLHIVPPCNIAISDMQWGLEVINECLGHVNPLAG